MFVQFVLFLLGLTVFLFLLLAQMFTDFFLDLLGTADQLVGL